MGVDKLTLGEIGTAWTAADFLLKCQARTDGDLLHPLTQISLDTLRADLGAAREEFAREYNTARQADQAAARAASAG
jgi:hypothetical protein